MFTLRAIFCAVLLLFVSPCLYAGTALDLRLPDSWEHLRPAAYLNGRSLVLTTPLLKEISFKDGLNFSAKLESSYLGERQQKLVLSTHKADAFGELAGTTTFSQTGMTTSWGYKTSLGRLARQVGWYPQQAWARETNFNLSAWYYRPLGAPGTPLGARTINASIPLVRLQGFELTATVSTIKAPLAVATDCRHPNFCVGVQAAIKLFK